MGFSARRSAIFLTSNHFPKVRQCSAHSFDVEIPGVEILSSAVLHAPIGENRIDVPAILEGLWHAAHGQLPPKTMLLTVDLVPPLDEPPSVDTREAAKQAFQEIVEESQLNGDLFQKLLMFLFQAIVSLTSFEDEVSLNKDTAVTDLMRFNSI